MADLTAPLYDTTGAAKGDSIELAWTDESENETGFRIERRRASGGSWTNAGETVADVEAYRDDGLDPDTRYEYRVRACNEGGCSEYSVPAEARTT